MKAKSISLAAILLTALFMFEAGTYAQDPTPTPTPESADTAKTAAAKTEPDELEEVSGDWGGVRSRWKEKGVTMEFRLTQFAQGTVKGGVRKEEEYTGKFKTEFKFDFGKLWGWNGWHGVVATDTRFAGPLLGGTGAINPVNTQALVPGPEGTLFTFGAVNLTKIIPIDMKKGNLVAVSFGRFDMLDLIDEDFFGGAGIDRFFNMAQIGPLTVLRQVPLITNGATVAWVKGGQPFITLAVIDPNDHSTDPGLAELFEDGVSFAPAINFPTKYWGKSGKHTIGGAITTKAYTPFDAIRQIIIPGPPVNPVEPKRGSWSINYVFRQYIVERAPRDGWGFFTQVSFADKATSPITTFFDLGLGGNGLFKSRPRDEFGISYAYTDLSKVLKDNLDLLRIGGRPRPEHQVEAFYNFHITPWLRLTGDLQIIRPTRPIADTAIIPGARLEIIF